MKKLSEFIKESYEDKLINNVKVVFNVYPEEFYINAPETYSESDIQIYLIDRLLPELPSEDRKYSKLLGKNDNNISDSYFEYEKFEHFPKENSKDIELNIEWEKEYDENNDESLDIFKLTKLKYIITFDEFEYKDEENSNSKDTINQIFSKFDSSNINKYPVEIKFDSSLLKYDEKE